MLPMMNKNVQPTQGGNQWHHSEIQLSYHSPLKLRADMMRPLYFSLTLTLLLQLPVGKSPCPRNVI